MTSEVAVINREVIVVKTATYVRDKKRFQGRASLYHVNPPIGYDMDYDTDEYQSKTDFVIVSTVVAPFSGLETFIFPADKNGEITSWGELDGSQRGTSSHREVLEAAGYTLDLGIRDAEVIEEG